VANGTLALEASPDVQSGEIHLFRINAANGTPRYDFKKVLLKPLKK
jgi:hypothetical protein